MPEVYGSQTFYQKLCSADLSVPLERYTFIGYQVRQLINESKDSHYIIFESSKALRSACLWLLGLGFIC
jgi:hypothetical protein